MIKNQNIVAQALSIIDTCIELSEYFLQREEIPTYGQLITDLDDGLKALLYLSKDFEKEMPTIKFVSTVENIQYASLQAIKKTSLKILQFEAIPLMEELRYMIYYWGSIYPDKKKIDEFMKNEVKLFCSNKYIDESEHSGKYKYELSISVLAYNKLEYTKLCVQSILDTVPENLSYELILINHGSTDGTQEYFESINPHKIFQLYRNNGNYSAVSRIIEGKHHLTFCNDVVALPNAIENMLKLASEDEKVAYIVPSTPNVSNLQVIPGDYSNFDEMITFGEFNNKYDAYRHEQRVRLCNPATFAPSCYSVGSQQGVFAGRYQYSADFTSFGDDKISLIYRRNGLKCILQKDAYCHHFGSVTIKDEVSLRNEQEYYNNGRIAFFKAYGIDPWGTGFCYDYELMQALPLDKTGHVDILGINCGIGSNPLKIKESIKENIHNLNVRVYNLTDKEQYKEDLKGVSDYVEIWTNNEKIDSFFEQQNYDYIIWEDTFDTDEVNKIIAIDLLKRLKNNGYFIINTKNMNVKEFLLRYKDNITIAKNWIIFEKL